MDSAITAANTGQTAANTDQNIIGPYEEDSRHISNRSEFLTAASDGKTFVLWRQL